MILIPLKISLKLKSRGTFPLFRAYYSSTNPYWLNSSSILHNSLSSCKSRSERRHAYYTVHSDRLMRPITRCTSQLNPTVIEKRWYGTLINLRSRRKKIWSDEDQVVCAEQRTRAIEFPMVSLYCIIALSTSAHSEGYASHRGQQWRHPRGPVNPSVLRTARIMGCAHNRWVRSNTRNSPRSACTPKILTSDTNVQMIVTIHFEYCCTDTTRSYCLLWSHRGSAMHLRISREKNCNSKTSYCKIYTLYWIKTEY